MQLWFTFHSRLLSLDRQLTTQHGCLSRIEPKSMAQRVAVYNKRVTHEQLPKSCDEALPCLRFLKGQLFEISKLWFPRNR